MPEKEKAHKVSVYLPPFHWFLVQAIADKNQEAVSGLLRRLLLSPIEEAASSSFRASNALHSAMKNEEIDPQLAIAIAIFMDRSKEG